MRLPETAGVGCLSNINGSQSLSLAVGIRRFHKALRAKTSSSNRLRFVLFKAEIAEEKSKADAEIQQLRMQVRAEQRKAQWLSVC